MVGNTATYLDSPFHRYPDRRDLSEIPLADAAGLPGVVLDGTVGAERAVSLAADESELAERAVLIRTGWDDRWGTDAYWEPGPYVSPEALELLLRAQPKLVGVDFWNVDDTSDPSRRGHTRLLAADILIVEHLCNLGALPGTELTFWAVPLRVVTGASLPVPRLRRAPRGRAPVVRLAGRTAVVRSRAQASSSTQGARRPHPPSRPPAPALSTRRSCGSRRSGGQAGGEGSGPGDGNDRVLRARVLLGEDLAAEPRRDFDRVLRRRDVGGRRRQRLAATPVSGISSSNPAGASR